MLTTDLLRHAYHLGFFPMAIKARSATQVEFYNSAQRAVIIPERVHVSRRLKRIIRQMPFAFQWNDDIRAVMQACNATRLAHQRWINDEMIDAYEAWHRETGETYCLSVFQNGQRVAGIFGVHLGGAMATADGMYSIVSNASSAGVVTLVAGMARAGICMIDLQYSNPHTERFGLRFLSPEDYLRDMNQLNQQCVSLKADYFDGATAIAFVQSLSQTS